MSAPRDLLAEMLGLLPAGGARVTRFVEPAPGLAWTIAPTSAMLLTLGPGGLRIQSDLTPWTGIEVALDAASVPLTIEVEALAARDMTMEAFLRTLAEDRAPADAPPARLPIGRAGTSRATVPLPAEEGGRHRLILLFPRPPLSFVLTRLTLAAA